MIKRFLAWLKSIYFKPAPAETPQREEQTMPDQVENAAEEQTATESDALVAKLKELVAAAGAQAHVVFDDLVDLAKKLV